MKYDITLKPTGNAKRAARMCPEYITTVEADSKEQAIIIARMSADRDGFRWYAVTKVKELKEELCPPKSSTKCL